MRFSCCVLCLICWLPAQSRPLAPKAALQRAILVEEAEKDLGEAKRLYAALAEGAADPEVRQQAAARLARVVALLQGQPQDVSFADERRAREALDKLRGDDEAAGKNGIAGLVFLGDPAVPVVATAAAEEKWNRLFVTRATQALVEIGSEKAAKALAALLAGGDLFLRKAALLGACAVVNEPPPAMRVGLAVFLRDPDQDLVAMALESFPSMRLPLADVTPKLADPRRDVRVRAYHQLSGWDRGGQEFLAGKEALVRQLEAGIERGDPEALDGVLAFEVETCAPGKLLFLRELARLPLPVPKKGGATGIPFPGAYDAKQSPQPIPGALPPVAELVEACRLAAQGIGKMKPAAPRMEAFATLQRRVHSYSESWGRPQLRGMIEIIRALGCDLGSGHPFRQFVLKTATGEDGLLVAELLTFAYFSDEELPALTDRIGGDSGADLLEKWIDAHWSDEQAPIQQAVSLLAYSRTPRAVRFVSGLLARRPGRYGLVTGSLLLLARTATPPAEVRAALVAALAHHDLADVEASYEPSARDRVFRRLVELGTKDAVPGFARAYELGLARSENVQVSEGTTRFLLPFRGVAWLQPGDVTEVQPPYRHEPAFDAKTRASILEACLATGTDAWSDAELTLVNQGTPAELLEVLCKHALEWPKEGFLRQLLQVAYAQGEPKTPEVLALMRRLLASPPELGLGALASTFAGAVVVPEAAHDVLRAMLGHPETFGVAVAQLTRARGGDLDADLVPLLKSDNPSIRAAVGEALVRRSGAKALEHVARLFEDPDAAVRTRMAHAATRISERAAVPHLLALLRDSEPEVRDAAKQSLERIQFVEQQQAFWAKLAKDAGLSATSAAEALVQQAQSGDPKVRLAAIDSLGTLAVPETLPVLIRLMQDKDADVVARAEAAVRRINAGKK